jgi:hypothetical protein
MNDAKYIGLDVHQATISATVACPAHLPALYNCAQPGRHSSCVSLLSCLDSMERMAAMSLVE